MIALKVVAGVVVVLVVSVAALRWRKLRRDERRVHAPALDRRLVTPPPSPYQPSKGFRLLDGPAPDPSRRAPERPRLEPERSYVFSETGAGGDDPLGSLGRHDAQWALARSSHRSGAPRGLALVVALVVVAIVAVAAVGYLTRHHRPGAPTTTSTSTTTSTPSTTTTTWPATLRPVTSTPTAATYDVAAHQYPITVRAVGGAVWCVFRMGPAHTLEYQGRVEAGSAKTLTMTGDSQITLGSPRNAQVLVGTGTVTLPHPLGAPLVLSFSATASTSG